MMILDQYGAPLKWEQHAKSGKLQQFYQKYQSGREKLASLPVCPKCERAGFRTKGWAINKQMKCDHCGYLGPAEYIYSAYKNEKLYK